MAYFLKKTNNKKGTYLQIYSSFYDPERRHTAHKAYKPIGYVHELQAKGIDDPISFYKEEVIRLNQEANAAKAAKKAKQISDDSPEKLIGYFPMKNINDKLSVKKYIDLMQTATDFRFNVFDMISALVYAPVFRRSTRKFPSFSSCHFFISFPASRFFLYLQQIFNALLGLFLLKKFF